MSRRIKLWYDEQPHCEPGWCAEVYDNDILVMTSEGWGWPVDFDGYGSDDGEAVQKAVAAEFPGAVLDYRGKQ